QTSAVGGEQLTQRLPGWPWKAALPRRVDWRKQLPSQSPARKPEGGDSNGQQDQDEIRSAEGDHSITPNSAHAASATRKTANHDAAASARIRTRRGGS